jgi:hypothetical protein
MKILEPSEESVAMSSNPDIPDSTGSGRAFNVSNTAIQCQVVTTL